MAPERITDVLTREEIRELTQASDLRGALSVATTWAIIAAAFALAAWRPGVLTIGAALVLLGGRHLALAILMHEASHRSLFRSRRLNDVIGRWLCAAPSWQHLSLYREHHLKHHAHTGTEQDTDLGLVEPFPTTRWGLVRKFARDLSGLTGLKRVAGLVLMDLELVSYTASTGARWLGRQGRSIPQIAATGLRNAAPMLITNGALLALLSATGHAWLYLLWAGAYLTTFSLFLRIRALAEHACTTDTANQFLNTRTTLAGPLARLTVAPHQVNYHLEHHLLMTVPHYRLERMHRILHDRGVFEHSPLARGYWEVLRTVGSGPAGGPPAGAAGSAL